jgi:hypothetical protein
MVAVREPAEIVCALGGIVIPLISLSGQLLGDIPTKAAPEPQ